MSDPELILNDSGTVSSGDITISPVSDGIWKHDGCAYLTVECRNKGCKPAELCPAGHRVYRNWTGGGHHHEDDE